MAATRLLSKSSGAPDDREPVLRLVATGIVALAEATAGGRPPRLPYPVPLQRGLDRLSVACLRAGVEPPASVPDLLSWCRRPFGEWKLPIVGPMMLGEGDRLLDGPSPTSVCQELFVDAADVESELAEQRILLKVLDVCRAASSQEAYVAFRRLLIERPVITPGELHGVLNDKPDLMILRNYISEAYQPAPAECVVGRKVLVCKGCGNLLVRNASRESACADERCRFHGQAVVRQEISLETVHPLWLIRPLRTFVAGAGAAEVRLAGTIKKLGLDVEMWPNFDTYDLKITFHGGIVWAVDVKDWVSAYLLARNVKPIPDFPRWDRAYFVFPEQGRERPPDYIRAFKRNCHVLSNLPPVDAAMEKHFLKLVRRRITGGAK